MLYRIYNINVYLAMYSYPSINYNVRSITFQILLARGA